MNRSMHRTASAAVAAALSLVLAALPVGAQAPEVGKDATSRPAEAPSPGSTEPPASRPADAATTRPLDPLRYMASRVAESINLDPPGVYDDYTVEFLLAFPFSELRVLFADFKFKHGPVREIAELRRTNASSGVFRLVFERKVGMRMELVITGEPAKITGLRFSEGLPAEDTREKALFALDGFGPVSGCALLTIPAEGEPKLFDGSRPDKRFNVAGAYKLYILGALLEDIASGARKWEDVVKLEGRLRSYPIGRLAMWAEGAPLTLHTLATLMTVENDDTAADHLLSLLGRERVESMLAPMGVADAASRLPLLSTRESYILKNEVGGATAGRFVAADTAGKRAILGELNAGPSPALSISPKPRFVDAIGFSASAEELSRALVWILRKTESGPAALGRALLALNPGLPIDDTYFTFTAYKGGAESGAYCGAWLLRRPDGRWFAFAAGWNDPENALDERRFTAWIQRYLELCAATL